MLRLRQDIFGSVAYGFGKVGVTYGIRDIGKGHARVTVGYLTLGFGWVAHGIFAAVAGNVTDDFRLASDFINFPRHNDDVCLPLHALRRRCAALRSIALARIVSARC